MRGTPPLRLLILGVKGVIPNAARTEAGLIVGVGVGMVGSLGLALVGLAAAQFVPPIELPVAAGIAGKRGLAFVGTAAPQFVPPIHEGRLPALGGRVGNRGLAFVIAPAQEGVLLGMVGKRGFACAGGGGGGGESAFSPIA